MKNVNMTVVSSTVTKNNNYCNKLIAVVNNEVETPFGKCISRKQKTYYMFTSSKCEVGTERILNLEKFEVKKKDFEKPSENHKDGVEIITLNYLFPKGE